MNVNEKNRIDLLIQSINNLYTAVSQQEIPIVIINIQNNLLAIYRYNINRVWDNEVQAIPDIKLEEIDHDVYVQFINTITQMFTAQDIYELTDLFYLSVLYLNKIISFNLRRI